MPVKQQTNEVNYGPIWDELIAEFGHPLNVEPKMTRPPKLRRSTKVWRPFVNDDDVDPTCIAGFEPAPTPVWPDGSITQSLLDEAIHEIDELERTLDRQTDEKEDK